MTIIEEPELKLLAYLFEHAGGYRQRIWLDPKPVVRGLGLSQEQFAEESAWLVAHGLAGVRKYSPDAVPAACSRFCAIWLTGKGEDFMRALHAALGLTRFLTAAMVKDLWAKGHGSLAPTAARLLAEFDNGARRRRRHAPTPLA